MNLKQSIFANKPVTAAYYVTFKSFKMSIKIYISILLLSIGLVSCESYEPKPDEPNVENPTDEDDSAKYYIVGSWRAQYKWSMSTEIINMDINMDGTLSYISTNDTYEQAPIVGNGTWKYNFSKHQWDFAAGYSMISGSYSLVGNQLITQTYYDDGSSKTVIYNKLSK